MAKNRKNWSGLGLVAGSAAVGAYVLVLRPWHLRWGATPEEVQRSLPGDEVVACPRISATHAVTVRAPAFGIWPWLAQLGHDRGGFYSYEFIENRLMGLKIENSDRILPEFQQLKAGDMIPMVPSGEGIPVLDVKPDQYLVLGGKIDTQTPGTFQIKDSDPNAYMAVTWTFYLQPQGENTTRLIERFRLDWYPPSLKNQLYMYAFLEPGAFVMERRMLLGIKERAERMALSSAALRSPTYPPRG